MPNEFDIKRSCRGSCAQIVKADGVGVTVRCPSEDDVPGKCAPLVHQRRDENPSSPPAIERGRRAHDYTLAAAPGGPINELGVVRQRGGTGADDEVLGWVGYFARTEEPAAPPVPAPAGVARQADNPEVTRGAHVDLHRLESARNQHGARGAVADCVGDLAALANEMRRRCHEADWQPLSLRLSSAVVRAAARDDEPGH